MLGHPLLTTGTIRTVITSKHREAVTQQDGIFARKYSTHTDAHNRHCSDKTCNLASSETRLFSAPNRGFVRRNSVSRASKGRISSQTLPTGRTPPRPPESPARLESFLLQTATCHFSSHGRWRTLSQIRPKTSPEPRRQRGATKKKRAAVGLHTIHPQVCRTRAGQRREPDCEITRACEKRHAPLTPGRTGTARIRKRAPPTASPEKPFRREGPPGRTCSVNAYRVASTARAGGAIESARARWNRGPDRF